MQIVETPLFTSQVYGLMDDEGYRSLQEHLVDRPDAGSLIPSGGGIRKIRWGGRGTGKRGGNRVIYFWVVEDGVIFMLLAYPKGKKGDLTRSELTELKELVKVHLT